ncbi:MAG: YIP1 family protein [Anaerolineae bacterium]|nr:YIP1 family protein [Anaerolineae bacterium]
MSEPTAPTVTEPPRRLHFDWVFPALFRPRRIFPQIVGGVSTAWLTPILILMAAMLLSVIAQGSAMQAAMSNATTMPSDFEYYSPEQQAQYQQSASMVSGPLFTIVLPGIGALLVLFIGWLAFGGLLHLVLTLFGGHGSIGTTIGMVAWANLPYAVRGLERALYMMASNRAIQAPGLSGMASMGSVPYAFLSLIDIFIIWHALLLFVGIHTGYGLSRGKALAVVLIAVGAVVLFQTGVGSIGTVFSWLAS